MRPAEPANPSRAPRTLPRTHIPPKYPYHDPSIKYAPARRPHEIMATQQYVPTTPDTQSVSSTIVFAAVRTSNWSLGWTTTFLECIALMDLNFWFLEAQSGFRLQLPCDTLYTVQQHFIPPISPSSTLFFSLLQYCGFVSFAGVTHVALDPNNIEMEWRESPLSFFSSNLVVICYSPPLLLSRSTVMFMVGLVYSGTEMFL